MTVDVEVGGRRRRVAVRRDGNGWVVVLDGRKLYVDVEASKRRWSLLVREAPEQPNAAVGAADASAAPRMGHLTGSYDVALEPLRNGERIVRVDGHRVPVRVEDPRSLFSRRGRHAAASGSGRVTAPMPGRVVKVLVRPGDAVAAGQPLVVVEAMKMENELRAPRDGTVSEVRAKEGTSIEANAVLIALAPHAPDVPPALEPGAS